MLEKYGIGAEVLGAALACLTGQIDELREMLADETLEHEQRLKLNDAQLKRLSELRQWEALSLRVQVASAGQASDEEDQSPDEDEIEQIEYAGEGDPRAGVMDWIIRGMGNGDNGSADARDLCFGYEAKARKGPQRSGATSVAALSLPAAKAYRAETGRDQDGAGLAGLADMVVHGRTRRWQDPGWR